MKLKFIILIVAIFSFAGGVAFAQSTAMPIVMGYLTTVGCSGSFTTCWVPYSSANPIPASLVIHP